MEIRRPPVWRRGRRVILSVYAFSVGEQIAEKGGRGRGLSREGHFFKKGAFFRETSSRGGPIRAFDSVVSDGPKVDVWAVFPKESAPFRNACVSLGNMAVPGAPGAFT